MMRHFMNMTTIFKGLEKIKLVPQPLIKSKWTLHP